MINSYFYFICVNTCLLHYNIVHSIHTKFAKNAFSQKYILVQTEIESFSFLAKMETDIDA